VFPRASEEEESSYAVTEAATVSSFASTAKHANLTFSTRSHRIDAPCLWSLIRRCKNVLLPNYTRSWPLLLSHRADGNLKSNPRCSSTWERKNGHSIHFDQAPSFRALRRPRAGPSDHLRLRTPARGRLPRMGRSIRPKEPVRGISPASRSQTAYINGGIRSDDMLAITTGKTSEA